MKRPITSFALLPESVPPLREAAVPAVVRIPLGDHEPVVAETEEVHAGQRIAESRQDVTGDIHASVGGSITAVHTEYIEIRTARNQQRLPGINVDEIEADLLPSALKSLGIDISKLRTVKTLVINALNPEPTHAVSDSLLTHGTDVIKRGLDLLLPLLQPEEVVLAVAQGSENTFGDYKVVEIDPFYPSCVDELVIAAVTGREAPPDAMALNLNYLYGVGRVAGTGYGLTETVVSIKDCCFRFKIGTPLGDVLKEVGLVASSGDRVIIGGPMRGDTAYSPAQGLPASARCVTLVLAGAFPPVKDSPCLSCGDCVMHCPARIRPDMIARHAEFGMWKDTLDYGLDICFECGICGYYCPGRRPLLQYIRLAKKELAALGCQAG